MHREATPTSASRARQDAGACQAPPSESEPVVRADRRSPRRVESGPAGWRVDVGRIALVGQPSETDRPARWVGIAPVRRARRAWQTGGPEVTSVGDQGSINLQYALLSCQSGCNRRFVADDGAAGWLFHAPPSRASPRRHTGDRAADAENVANRPHRPLILAEWRWRSALRAGSDRCRGSAGSNAVDARIRGSISVADHEDDSIRL
jgi:hypothetical protein